MGIKVERGLLVGSKWGFVRGILSNWYRKWEEVYYLLENDFFVECKFGDRGDN